MRVSGDATRAAEAGADGLRQSLPSIVDRSITGLPVIPDDRPWIPTFYGEQKYLRLNIDTGEWVILARIHPGQPVPYHKHHGGLHLWILEGELRFIDEDWSAGPGTYVYEPPGNTHTELSKPGVVMLVWSRGPLEFLNPDNTPIEVRDCVAWRREILDYHAANDIPLPPAPGYFF